MDLLQLEHFLAVVDEGSFTRAAERVYRTQSAISQSIKKLEDLVGSPLFARDGSEVCLTQSGKLLVDYARRILCLRDEAARSLVNLRHLVAGSLSVAAHESAAVYLLPGPLKAYLAQFPDIRVSIQRSRLDEVPRRVMDREVELGFVKDEPCLKELSSVCIHDDEMVVVAPPGHPVTRRVRPGLADLASSPFVVHQNCLATTDRLVRFFDEHGHRCRVAAELWCFENIKQFVREGIGLALVPRIVVARELGDGSLAEVPIPGLSWKRCTRVIFRDRRYLSEAALALVAIVTDTSNAVTRRPGPRPVVRAF